MRLLALLTLFLATIPSFAQDVNAEYDKNHDFSIYKTFSMGEAEVITPKDQQQVNGDLLIKWVKEAIIEELHEKGLVQVDSGADLVASFVVGSQPHTDVSQLGPLGQVPGNDSQTWSRDYRLASLIIDLNDKRDILVWRIDATMPVTNGDFERQIEQVVAAGYRKLSIKPKKKKK